MHISAKFRRFSNLEELSQKNVLRKHLAAPFRKLLAKEINFLFGKLKSPELHTNPQKSPGEDHFRPVFWYCFFLFLLLCVMGFGIASNYQDITF